MSTKNGKRGGEDKLKAKKNVGYELLICVAPDSVEYYCRDCWTEEDKRKLKTEGPFWYSWEGVSSKEDCYDEDDSTNPEGEEFVCRKCGKKLFDDAQHTNPASEGKK
jgi:DNA-directed RNA polymerase subunit RPC12/RpoP